MAEQLPDAVGLCPDPAHTQEFYMPLELPLASPFVRCPEGGCNEYLVVYVRVDADRPVADQTDAAIAARERTRRRLEGE